MSTYLKLTQAWHITGQCTHDAVMAAGGFSPVVSRLGEDGQAVQLAVVAVSQMAASNQQSKDVITAADSFLLHFHGCPLFNI